MSIFSLLSPNPTRKFQKEFDLDLLESRCVCCISCHFLTQWSTNSSMPLSDSSSVVIYDLHTLLHKNTHLHKQIISWHAGSRSGCTRSVPMALSGWRVWCGQIEDKGTFITGKAIAGTSERKRERKNEKQKWCLQLCSNYSENVITRPPYVYVQLYASHMKALWLCLTIGGHLYSEDRWTNGDDQLDATVSQQKENKKIRAVPASCWTWSFQDEVEGSSPRTVPFSTQTKTRDKVKERLLINI